MSHMWTNEEINYEKQNKELKTRIKKHINDKTLPLGSQLQMSELRP